MKTSIWIFLADQLLHLVIIVFVWLAYSGQFQLFNHSVTALINSPKFWWLFLMFILLSAPSSILIGKLTQKWSNELEATGLYKGLENAGK